MSTTYPPLNTSLGIDSSTYFDFPLLIRILQAIDLRLQHLYGLEDDLVEAEAVVRQVALDRINEVLTPAIQSVFVIQERGFLVAHSASSGTLGNGNVLTLVIDDDDERSVFVASPFVALTRAANITDYGIARTISYDNVTGTLTCSVISYQGAAGPHTDWVIGALAGSTIAQYAMLDDMVAARDAALTAKTNAETARDASAASATASSGSATAAAASQASATSSATTATTKAAEASASAAAAAASAASISGGPVTSVDGKTGVVYTDPIAVTGVLPTLDLDFTASNGAPFDDCFSRPSVGGYRMNSRGVLVSTAAVEPVIDFASDGTPQGTGFWGAYTQLLLNSTTLSTQSVATSATTYTLSFWGTGTVTLSGSATGTLAGTGANNRVSMTFAASAGTLTLTVAGSVTMASLTATGFAVPYVDAAGSAVARSADALTIVGTDFTEFFNPTEGTIYFDGYLDAADATGRMMLQFDDGSNTNRIYVLRNTASKAEIGVVTGGVAQATLVSVADWTAGINKLAASVTANSFLLSFGGATAVVDTSGTMPISLSTLRIGASVGGATPANSHIRRIAYLPKALSATQIQRMTA